MPFGSLPSVMVPRFGPLSGAGYFPVPRVDRPSQSAGVGVMRKVEMLASLDSLVDGPAMRVVGVIAKVRRLEDGDLEGGNGLGLRSAGTCAERISDQFPISRRVIGARNFL